jgi:hypothetical protein
MAADNLLTRFRLAVWEAVDTYPALKDRFKLKLRYEKRSKGRKQIDPTPRLLAPSKSIDLPAIAIYPARNAPRWYDNQNLILPYTLVVDVWTIGWTPDTAEDIWDDFVDAVYRQGSAETPTVPLVRAVTRNFVLEPLVFRRGRLKNDTKVAVLQTTFGITGHFAKNPKTQGE